MSLTRTGCALHTKADDIFCLFSCSRQGLICHLFHSTQSVKGVELFDLPNKQELLDLIKILYDLEAHVSHVVRSITYFLKWSKFSLIKVCLSNIVSPFIFGYPEVINLNGLPPVCISTVVILIFSIIKISISISLLTANQ